MMMKVIGALGLCLLLHSGAGAQAQPEGSPAVVLSHRVMELTNISAHLSALAYDEDPKATSDMEFLHFFDDEPDQALVVKAHGYCFGVFRGTTLTWEDWSQNLELGYEDVCAADAEEKTCCTTRSGFYHAYNTTYKNKVEKDLRECAQTCEDKDECVVLTGHSQGGAIAAVAGVALAVLNPYVITFGQPATILTPCERITSKRWYRWVNTKDSEALTSGISYDPVPFVPGMGAVQFGHMILIADDNSGVAYVGLDSNEGFGPLDVGGFEAHNMIGSEQYPGYADRIENIMDLYNESDKYPIRTSGFIAGSYCTENVECESLECARETGFSWARCVGTECDEDGECDSSRCDSGLCVPKLGSCQVCDENSDCESGLCSWRFRCAENEEGLMGDQCLCNVNTDCVSGRCEGVHPPICEARLANGAACNEKSDCISGFCSWSYVCVSEEEYIKEAIAIKEKSGIVVIGLVVFALILGCCLLQRWYSNRRKGYEEIPARLNV